MSLLPGPGFPTWTHDSPTCSAESHRILSPPVSGIPLTMGMGEINLG